MADIILSDQQRDALILATAKGVLALIKDSQRRFDAASVFTASPLKESREGLEAALAAAER